jgi:hypothetical protein
MKNSKSDIALLFFSSVLIIVGFVGFFTFTGLDGLFFEENGTEFRSSVNSDPKREDNSKKLQYRSEYQENKEIKTEQVEKILARVQKLRKLTSDTLPKVEYMSRKQVGEYMSSRMVLNKNSVNQEELVLKALNLIPPEYNLSDAYDAYLNSYVQGFYDSGSDRMVISEDSNKGLEPLLSHELTHYLQHKNFNLTRLQRGKNSDEYMAVNSLIEGDANYLMREYMEANTPGNQFSNVSFDPFVNGFLEYQFSFPYIHGLKFVENAVKYGGMEYLNKVFLRPPSSTEQILDFSKYVQNEAPVPVNFQPKGEVTYESVIGAGNWVKIFEMNDIHTDCATGWGGDKIFISESDNRKSIFIVLKYDTGVPDLNQDQCINSLVEKTDFSSNAYPESQGEYILYKDA